jgi:hypothetical protein
VLAAPRDVTAPVGAGRGAESIPKESAPRGHPVHEYGFVLSLAGLLTHELRAAPTFPVVRRHCCRVSTSGHFGVRSSLTVAGAVTVLAPFGSSAPCSLLIPWSSSVGEPSTGGTSPPPRLVVKVFADTRRECGNFVQKATLAEVAATGLSGSMRPLGESSHPAQIAPSNGPVKWLGDGPSFWPGRGRPDRCRPRRRWKGRAATWRRRHGRVPGPHRHPSLRGARR